ncbi:unnamed protein product [marine sediment metagenome]|uniref:Uncharacterized protein n=1 Tax=marine sediment metagenome TaxID=412755 RepID=X1LE52_9ZZZZ
MTKAGPGKKQCGVVNFPELLDSPPIMKVAENRLHEIHNSPGMDNLTDTALAELTILKT